jgi:GDPmannose 4,6-dehydratase
MWLMMQHERPDDYVIATGESHSVREFLDVAGEYLNLDWQRYVRLDPRYLRPAEVDHLLGDATYARTVLGWRPATSFEGLVRKMVEHDLELARQEFTLRDHSGTPRARTFASAYMPLKGAGEKAAVNHA